MKPVSESTDRNPGLRSQADGWLADGVRPERGGSSGTVVRAFRKYSKILRIALIERMTYRGDFFLATILRFLPMLTTILLWHAVYAGVEAGPGEPAQLSGYNLHDMVAYLLLVHI